MMERAEAMRAVARVLDDTKGLGVDQGVVLYAAWVETLVREGLSVEEVAELNRRVNAMADEFAVWVMSRVSSELGPVGKG